MFDPKIFGQRLFSLRKQKIGVTQADIADLLEVTPTQISDMEKGRRTTGIDSIVLLCRHYNVSADYLLGLTDKR